MPEQSSFRQVDEKHVSAEVECMAWSPKMDLIAVANVQGEVILYRLSWQKVWMLSPITEESLVTTLAWRPDGKVLAVGYNTSKVLLVDVENSDVLHTLGNVGHVTSLTWISKFAQRVEETPEAFEGIKKECFEDKSTQFLPKLPSLNKSFGNLSKSQSEDIVEDSKRLKGQNELNILLTGSQTGQIMLYAYGIFPIGCVDITIPGDVQVCRVLSAALSKDLKALTAIMHGDDQQLHQVVFDTSLLASRHKELSLLALKYGQISTLLGYLRSTIKQMSEAWEDILRTMDSKLLKFAEKKYQMASGTVSNDFLELLMFGTPSDELQTFLLQDLTEKGLKKLGHSIETSYSNIQKLVLKQLQNRSERFKTQKLVFNFYEQLQNVGHAIMYHLGDLSGMSQWEEKFGILGLSNESLQAGIACTGSFMLKACELQLVIDSSMKNFKAFFRWLYVVIQRLSDEPVPAELNKMTQQLFNFVAEFLKEHFQEEFDDDGNFSEEKKPGFKLEKVGQYLKNEDLHDPPDNENNPWVKFLATNPTIRESPMLFPACNKNSLVQMHEELETCLENALTQSSTNICSTFQCQRIYSLLNMDNISSSKDISPKVEQFTLSSGEDNALYSIFLADSLPCDRFYVSRHPTVGSKIGHIELAAVKFGSLGPGVMNLSLNLSGSERFNLSGNERQRPHKIHDIACYDEKTISVLLVEDNDDAMPILVQFPLTALTDDHFVALPTDRNSTDLAKCLCSDGGPLVPESSYKKLENMKAISFAVSGTRKVACVLFSSKRRVRLFLMDVDDEDEDDESEAGSHDNTAADTTGGEGMNDIEDEDQFNDEDKENTSVRMDL